MVNIFGISGGISSDDVTASRMDVLKGASTITQDSNGEVVEGTIPRLNSNTYCAGLEDIVAIHSGLYINEPQFIKGITQTNLTSGNIKPGVTVKINNGEQDIFSVTGNMSSKGAANYYATTSDQIINAGQYLSGNQVIKAVSQTNLTAANIKNGETVKISNGRSNIFSVTGNYTGTKKAISAVAWYGFASSENYTSEEKTFTMPRNGVVYYGGVSTFYNGKGTGTCEIYKNNQLIDSRNSGEDFTVRSTMTDKSFTASAGDVIKVKATATSGSSTLCMIQAICIY